MTQDPIRHYVVLDTANEDVRTGYFNPNLARPIYGPNRILASTCMDRG